MSPKEIFAKSSAKGCINRKIANEATDASSKQAKPKTSVTPSDFPKPVREYWEQLDWSNLSDSFGDRTLQRGRGYVEDRNVRSLWATEDGMNLLAAVVGTHEYNTLVVLKEGSRKNQFALSSVCSCPVGFNCKHGVATIVCFLDYLAKNQPIPLCRENGENSWEIVSESGKTKTMKINRYEHEDEDDDWEDDEDGDEEELAKPSRLSKPTSKKASLATSLEAKLNGKPQKELVALVLHLFHEYGDVRTHFEQEAFAEAVAQSGNITKLIEKAIKLFDKEVDRVTSDYRSRYRRYEDRITLDLGPVIEVVKQFRKFEDALTAVDRVARHLITKGIHYLNETGADDGHVISDVFDELAESLLASKTPPVSTILWAYEISHIDEYDFGGYTFQKHILERDWPVKIWSAVADALIAKLHEDVFQNRNPQNRNHWSLQTIVETLDKACRQGEATDLLRTEAVQAREYAILADRLIEYGSFDEAEKICREQRQIELKEKQHSNFYREYSWSGRLKKIAEKRADYPTQASIEASAFFENPSHETVAALLLTAKKMKIEPMVRRAIEAFLQTGKFPAMVQKGLEGAKPTAKEQDDWQIPFFAFHVGTRERKPRFDILCEWAIAEQRSDDIVRWLDEHSKQKGGNVRDISREKVADAICDSHPDRAFRLYRDLVEHEMEGTRNYFSAIRLLRKIQTALEDWGRSADWQPLLAEIRAAHRRKSSLMKQLDELEAGSIVNQKRQEK